MTGFGKYITLIIFLLGFVLIQLVESKMNTKIEESYLGGYTKSEMESISRLVLLDDRTFLFTFMGGSLDLAAVGYWELNANPESGISLKEVRLQTQTFPAYIEKTDKDDQKVKFIFNGYSLSNATQPVFAVSKTEIMPSRFTPLFERGQSNWRSEYELPPFDIQEVKFFYIGYVQTDKFDVPVKLKVFQYKLENGSKIKIGFDQTAVSPLMNMTAVLENNTLILDGSNFGTRDVLPADIIKDIRQNHINPVLYPDKAKKTEDTQNPKKALATKIFPIKEKEFELSAISGASFKFVPEDPFAFKYEDWSYLKDEFDKASANSHEVPGFLKVSEGLVEHNAVEKQNAGSLVNYFNELLNKNSKQAENQFKIIDIFIDKIEPAIRNFRKDKSFNKSFEIFVSNSLGVVIYHKNEALKLKIYKMLGADFDIHKIEHGTLLYNLACDYSLKKEKEKMLEAIKLAISKGKNPENFAKDTDFQFYYSDPDFIKAISNK